MAVVVTVIASIAPKLFEPTEKSELIMQIMLFVVVAMLQLIVGCNLITSAFTLEVLVVALDVNNRVYLWK